MTARLRERLKAEKLLGAEERTFAALVPLHLTEAERSDARLLPEGSVVQFMRKSGTFKPGNRVAVTASTREDLAGRASAVAVYRPQEIKLAVGDAIRITANGQDISGKHRLNNGAVYAVVDFTDDGVRLSNGWTIGSDFGHVSHGYTVTSHASQGRTVIRVLVAMPEATFPAVGKEQFYVSVSRGRQQATIYTDSKEGLSEAIHREDARMLAHDLAPKKPKKKGLRSRMSKFMAFMRSSVSMGRA